MLIELKKKFEYNFIDKIKDSLGIITKELSVIIWISIVLALIIWSYVQNENEISQRAQMQIYEKLSIIEEIE